MGCEFCHKQGNEDTLKYNNEQGNKEPKKSKAEQGNEVTLEIENFIEHWKKKAINSNQIEPNEPLGDAMNNFSDYYNWKNSEKRNSPENGRNEELEKKLEDNGIRLDENGNIGKDYYENDKIGEIIYNHYN